MMRASWLTLGLLLSVAVDLRADEPKGTRIALFDGTSLNGWIVTGCDVAVENGVLVLKDGDGFVRTEHRYADFVLEFQCRARKPADWDSGVYFRAELPPEGKAWPTRYQANLKQGREGNVAALPGAESRGLFKPGEWNRLRLTVVGDRAEMEINGQPAWKVEGVAGPSGYVGLQSEVAGGGQWEFKDLSVTELGYRSLFNGTDLAGWEGASGDAAECWKVSEGRLMCTGKKGPWLRSLEEFGDFNLRLKYQLKGGGNSGVYVRVPKDGRHHGEGAGVEVQVLDDHAAQYKSLEPYQYAASVYKIAPAKERVAKPTGQWNSLEIDCQGSSYRVTHNGVVVVDAKVEEFPELGRRLTKGFFGLQNHSTEVFFREIRLGPPMK